MRSTTGLEDVSITYRAPYMRFGRMLLEDLYLVPCSDAPPAPTSPPSTGADQNGLQWVSLVSPLFRRQCPPQQRPNSLESYPGTVEAPRHPHDSDDKLLPSLPVHVPNWTASLELQELKCASCSQTGIIAARAAASLRRCTSCSYCAQCQVVVLSMVLDDDPSSRHANSIRLTCTSCRWISARFPDVASVQRWTKQCAALVTTGAGCGASLPSAALHATHPSNGFSLSRRVRERASHAAAVVDEGEGEAEGSLSPRSAKESDATKQGTVSARGARCVSFDRLLVDESKRVERFEHIVPTASHVGAQVQLPQRCCTVAELAAAATSKGEEANGVSVASSLQGLSTPASVTSARNVSMRGTGLSLSTVRPFPWFETATTPSPTASQPHRAASPVGSRNRTTDDLSIGAGGEAAAAAVAVLPAPCALLQPPLHPRFRVVALPQRSSANSAALPSASSARRGSWDTMPATATQASTAPSGATRRMSFRRDSSLQSGGGVGMGSGGAVTVSCTAALDSTGGEPTVASFTSALANQALASSLCATRYVPRLTVLANLSRCLKQDVALAAASATIERRIFLNLHSLSGDVGVTLVDVYVVNSEGCAAAVSLPAATVPSQHPSEAPNPLGSTHAAGSLRAQEGDVRRAVSRISSRLHHRVPNTVCFADNGAADALFPERSTTEGTAAASSDRRPAASHGDGGLTFGVHLVFPPRSTETQDAAEQPNCARPVDRGDGQRDDNGSRGTADDDAPLDSSHAYCWFELAFHVALASPTLSATLVGKFGAPNVDEVHLWYHAIVAFKRPKEPCGAPARGGSK